jgi:hypothetical protein
MILLNFSNHPLTKDQKARAEALTGQQLDPIISVDAQFNDEQPLLPQVQALLDGLPLSLAALESEALMVSLPGLSPAAALLLVELHGRTGHFPYLLRLRYHAGRYEVAETPDLQSIRNGEARKTR